MSNFSISACSLGSLLEVISQFINLTVDVWIDVLSVFSSIKLSLWDFCLYMNWLLPLGFSWTFIHIYLFVFLDTHHIHSLSILLYGTLLNKRTILISFFYIYYAGFFEYTTKLLQLIHGQYSCTIYFVFWAYFHYIHWRQMVYNFLTIRT